MLAFLEVGMAGLHDSSDGTALDRCIERCLCRKARSHCGVDGHEQILYQHFALACIVHLGCDDPKLVALWYALRAIKQMHFAADSCHSGLLILHGLRLAQL